MGCGRWGANILRDLRQLGASVDVVARSEASRRRAADGGADQVVDRIDALEAVDGAVVATPTSTHAEVVEELLSATAGPLFVEKPLTNDAGVARRLAQRASGRVFVMDKWRYHPGIEALRDLSRGERLGTTRGLIVVRLQWGSAHRDVDPVWILSPHDLSIALEILGHVPEPLAASGEWLDGSPAGICGLLEGGVRIESSAAAPAFRREVRLIGETGVGLLADPYADHIEVRRPGGEEPERIPISTEWPLLRELRTFLEHVGGGPPPRSSVEEGATIVETLSRLRTMAGLDA